MDTEKTQKFESFKKEVLVDSIKDAIIHDFEEGEFREFLIKLVVERGNIKQDIAQQLFDEAGCQKMKVAFTHPSMLEPINFEFFESMGDLTANKCIGWYLYRRFPDLQNNPQSAMYMCELKKKYISKKLFGPFSQKLGLDKFIRYKEIKYVEALTHEKKTVILNKSVYEDVFEAFCACLEDLIDTRVVIGCGYQIIYNIISTLMDEEVITLDIKELVDKKTQIKELMDRRNKAFGDVGPTYSYVQEEQSNGQKFWVTTLKLELQAHPNREYRGKLPLVVEFKSPATPNRNAGEFDTAGQALRWFESYGVRWSR